MAESNKMKEMPVNKLMIQMGIPMILSMALQAVYNIVDSAFVGNMKAGSGGRFIGEEVAKKLGIAYYDKDIINQIAKQSGLSPEYIQEKAELSPKKGMFAYAFTGRDITGKSIEDIVYEAQRKLFPEITSNTVIAWRRNIPYSQAVSKFIEEINASKA